MKLAVLLHGSIQNDYRVIKTIQTISKITDGIWVFHVGENKDVLDIFKNSKIKVISCPAKKGLYSKIKAHSFFCYEYLYLKESVLQANIKFDFIWANDLPTLLPAYRIKKQLNAKLIYDSHEIYNETINQFFPREAKGIKKVIFTLLIYFMRFQGKYIERKLIHRLDHFITVNQSLLDYFKNEYSLKSGEVIMNLPRLSDTKPEVSPFDFRQTNNWGPHHKILLYQGALNEGRGLKLLIDTVEALHEKYRLVIIGNGLLKEELQEIVRRKNLEERIHFVDAVPLKELPSFTKGADIGINLLEDFNLSKKLASPNKLFEYIHAGIPVLGTNTIENSRVVERYKIGELCNNNIDSFIEAIKKMEKNNYLEELNKAKAYYNWENQESKLINLFED